MTHLFEPYTLRGVTLRNRIGVAPMCQYSSEAGMPNDWHLVHLGTRAAGGVGLVIAEATAVEARGRISPNDVGIWNDEQAEAWKRITQFIRQQGAVAGIQLAHAGRKASNACPWERRAPLSDAAGGWDVIAASAIPFNEGYRTPKEMTREDIHEVQLAFRDSAVRALEAGFEWLELHAAHGYLLHSFYSPISNQRTDEYGGSFENRIRFLLETVRLVREAIPAHLPLTVRLSCTDWIDGGWTLEDSIELAKHLKQAGVDLIDCSSGGISPLQQVITGKGYQVPFAASVRREAEIATAAVGLITEPAYADELVRNGDADLILLGRELLRNPYWALQAAQALHQAGTVPPQYLTAF